MASSRKFSRRRLTSVSEVGSVHGDEPVGRRGQVE